jgi:hypothetical protein
VILEAESSLDGSPSSLAGATVGQFTVQIDGANATVVSGSPVGDQFWLMVRPAEGVYSAGSKYDLSVTWAGHGADSETRAVLFTDREITDRAIVVDRSGSMTEFDKMAAAQNAARLFIDQSLPEDRIAVVSFSDGAAVDYGITEVPNIGPSAILDNAKAAVDGLTPSGWTAIGQGLLEGQNQVTAALADHSLADVVILLSDGMENVDPLYDTPAVKGVIEPTDTIIHTVGVGPSSAGFFSLLDDIADDNGGDFIPVNQDGASRSGRAGDAVSGLTAIGFDVWPTLLPNRLGDVYKQFAETILDEVRLYQAQGMGVGRAELPVLVPDGLKRVTFALNWSQPGSQIYFLLTDPEGNEYFDPQKPEGGICRTDPTHQTCIVENPKGGVWTVFVAPIKVSESNEWVFWASAKTGVNFDLFVGTPEHQRNAGDPVHLLAFLGEGEKAFGDGSVRVKIFGPNGFGPFELDLFDDGLHGDGSVKDGIYGNHFLDGDLPGAYAVRGVAKGNNMLGQAFEIYKNTGFKPAPAHRLPAEGRRRDRRRLRGVDRAKRRRRRPDPHGQRAARKPEQVPHVHRRAGHRLPGRVGQRRHRRQPAQVRAPDPGAGRGRLRLLRQDPGAHRLCQRRAQRRCFGAGAALRRRLLALSLRDVDGRPEGLAALPGEQPPRRYPAAAGPDKSAALRSPRHGQALRQPDHGERVLDALGLPGRPEADDDGRTPALHQRGVPHDAVRAFLLVYE